MNKYVQEIMNSSEGLPKTFEEFQLMHPVHARLVPMNHIQKLRDEFDRRESSINKPYTPIDFK